MSLCSNNLSLLQMTQHVPLHVTLTMETNRWRLSLINSPLPHPCKDNNPVPWITLAPLLILKGDVMHCLIFMKRTFCPCA